MKNFKKLMSLFLAVLMLCGVLTSLAVIPAAAEDPAGDSSVAPEEETKTIDSLYTEIYGSPEEKLATMKEMTTKGNYTIPTITSKNISMENALIQLSYVKRVLSSLHTTPNRGDFFSSKPE